MSLPNRLLLAPGLLINLALLLAPTMARADVSCSVSMTSMNFGNVDPALTSPVTTSGSISFTCSNNAFLATARVTLCLNIGAGSSSGGQTNPWRYMDGPPGNALQFQIYKDAAHAQSWGSEFTPANPSPLQLQFRVPGGFFGPGTYSSPTYSVYGLLPRPQTGVSAGSYNNSFSGINAAISGQFYTGGNSYPADCGGTNSGASFPFTVTANVQPACTVTATDMSFGNAGLLDSAVHDAASMVGVTCVNGTAWKIGLDNGQHAVGNTRRMQGPGGFVDYELYRNNGRSQRWGNNPGVDTVNGNGNGSVQNHAVYGRVPSQTTPSAGTYSDTITVSVTY